MFLPSQDAMAPYNPIYRFLVSFFCLTFVDHSGVASPLGLCQWLEDVVYLTQRLPCVSKQWYPQAILLIGRSRRGSDVGHTAFLRGIYWAHRSRTQLALVLQLLGGILVGVLPIHDSSVFSRGREMSPFLIHIYPSRDPRLL